MHVLLIIRLLGYHYLETLPLWKLTCNCYWLFMFIRIWKFPYDIDSRISALSAFYEAQRPRINDYFDASHILMLFCNGKSSHVLNISSCRSHFGFSCEINIHGRWFYKWQYQALSSLCKSIQRPKIQVSQVRGPTEDFAMSNRGIYAWLYPYFRHLWYDCICYKYKLATV